MLELANAGKMFTVFLCYLYVYTRDGLPDGDGVFEAGNGDVYIGKMEDGLPNGQGEFLYGQV